MSTDPSRVKFVPLAGKSGEGRRRVLDSRDLWTLAPPIVVLFVVIPFGAWLGGAFKRWEGAGWRLGFDGEAFIAAPLMTQIHLLAILILFAAGCGMLALPKGDKRHRVLGWLWVIAMTVMGVASALQPFNASSVAGLAGGGSALALMAYGVWSARRHRAVDHGRAMLLLMISLIFITGLALLPGRLLHKMLFSA
jgi:uncharacterized membrane protein